MKQDHRMGFPAVLQALPDMRPKAEIDAGLTCPFTPASCRRSQRQRSAPFR